MEEQLKIMTNENGGVYNRFDYLDTESPSHSLSKSRKSPYRKNRSPSRSPQRRSRSP